MLRGRPIARQLLSGTTRIERAGLAKSLSEHGSLSKLSLRSQSSWPMVRAVRSWCEQVAIGKGCVRSRCSQGEQCLRPQGKSRSLPAACQP